MFNPNTSNSSTNLFIRYLPEDVDDTELRELFSVYGEITSSMVMRDIHSGVSLGTAFVRYGSNEEAQRALQEASHLMIRGCTLSLQWARKQHDGIPAGEDRRKMNKLFLRNLPLSADEEEIARFLSVCGTVTRVSIHRDTEPLVSPSLQRRIAFVTFAEEGAAEKGLVAFHHTCPLTDCNGVPLMAKLIRDSFKPRKKNAHRRRLDSNNNNNNNNNNDTNDNNVNSVPRVTPHRIPPAIVERDDETPPTPVTPRWQEKNVIVFRGHREPFTIIPPSQPLTSPSDCSSVSSFASYKEGRSYTHNPYGTLIL